MNNIIITFANAIDPTSGGVERVYHNLTPYFTSHGYNVYAVYRISSSYDENSVYTKAFHVDAPISSPQYIETLDKIMKENRINIVIYPFVDYELYRYFSHLKDIKVFFRVHNVPSKLFRKSVSVIPKCLKGTWIDKITGNIRKCVRFNASFKRLNRNGMKIIILSESFRTDLLNIYKFQSENVIALPNPLVIDNKYSLRLTEKEKIILYVGRINSSQKRFQSLLNIWKILQDKLVQYRLEIVGGGTEQAFFEKMAHSMCLKRITFHGFTNPTEYYKRAPILCMTSNYEGFPMVLVEAMQYGCVPFAFDSFPSLYDIINDGINGVIVPAFDEDSYAKKVMSYLSQPIEKRSIISANAIRKSQTFDINAIGSRWIELFEKP